MIDDPRLENQIAVKGAIRWKRIPRIFWVDRCVEIPEDEAWANREYQYRSGVSKIMLTTDENHPAFLLFLTSGKNCVARASVTDFVVSPEGLDDGSPVAEIIYYGRGPRFGPFTWGLKTGRAICKFASREQMESYLNEIEPINVAA